MWKGEDARRQLRPELVVVLIQHVLNRIQDWSEEAIHGYVLNHSRGDRSERGVPRCLIVGETLLDEGIVHSFVLWDYECVKVVYEGGRDNEDGNGESWSIH